MGLIVLIVLAVMVIYSLEATAEEKKGNQERENAAQGVISTGWIVLAIIVMILMARGS